MLFKCMFKDSLCALQFRYVLLKSKTEVQSKSNLEFKIMFNRYNNIKFTKNEFHYKLSEYIRRNVMYPKRIDDIMFMKTFRGVLESITQLVTTRLYLITKQHNNMILSHYDDNTGTCCCVKRIRAVTPI